MEDDDKREEILRCVSGLLIYAMRFGYMGTAKGAGRKGNMLFPEGKRF
jgi:hypothetical protein